MVSQKPKYCKNFERNSHWRKLSMIMMWERYCNASPKPEFFLFSLFIFSFISRLILVRLGWNFHRWFSIQKQVNWCTIDPFSLKFCTSQHSYPVPLTYWQPCQRCLRQGSSEMHATTKLQNCRSSMGKAIHVVKYWWMWMNFHQSSKKCSILTTDITENNLKPHLNQCKRQIKVQQCLATRGSYVHNCMVTFSGASRKC